MEILKGDVYLVDLNKIKYNLNYNNNIQNGVRPCMIIQNDMGNKYSPNTIICAGTSKINKRNLPTHVTLTSQQYDNLKMDTTFMTEMIYTIPKEWLIKDCKYLFKINNLDQKRLDKCILTSMGIVNVITSKANTVIA